MLEQALAGARELDAEAEKLSIREKVIKPCDGCFSCTKTGNCHIKDDMQEIYLKVRQSDAIIWATPVYFFGMAGQTKILIDRLYCLSINGQLSNKVGAVISVATAVGHSSVQQAFSSFLSLRHVGLLRQFHVAGRFTPSPASKVGWFTQLC